MSRFAIAAVLAFGALAFASATAEPGGPAPALLPAPVGGGQDPPKKYELKLKWKPVAGAKTEMSDDGTNDTSVKLSADGQVLKEEKKKEKKVFKAVETAVKCEKDKVVEARWAFSKAMRVGEEKEVTYGFEGKTVVVTTKESGERSFAYEDGGKLSKEDLEGIRGAFGGSDDKDKPSGDEIFSPKQPVAIGESWTPDLSALARSLGGDMGKGVDLKKSKGTLTLKSVEVRDGVEFGRIAMEVELLVGQVGPLELKSPFPMKWTADLDVCIDGKVPDGAMRVKVDMKGESAATVPNAEQEFQLAMEVVATGTLQRRAAK